MKKKNQQMQTRFYSVYFPISFVVVVVARSISIF